MLEVNVAPRTVAARAARPARRALGFPSASAAIAAGLVAGAVALLLLEFLAISIYDESPWKLFRMMAAMVRGRDALDPSDEFDAGLVAIGLALHFALALLYSLALACLIAELPQVYAGLAGALLGIALFYANFYGFAALFPWFISHRTVDTLVVHAVFGGLVARGYWQFVQSPDR